VDKFIILTDVTSDLSEEIRNYFDIKDYVHGHIHLGNDVALKTQLDWELISRDDFYAALDNKKIKVSTAPASPEEYYEKFRSYAAEGYDIISLSISGKISSTYQVAVGASERVKKEFPDRKIYCLDSCRMSGSLGLITTYAHELQRDGKSFDEIIKILEEAKHRVHQMGPIDDLMVVARRGRISTGKAIMGSFAGVKPMGDCNRDGYVSVLAKAKGIKKALAATVEYIKRGAVDIENNYIIITHSNREAYALTLKEKLEAELSPKGVFVSDVFSASGTNIGAGMICANFFGEPISESSEVEKEILTAAIEACR
jgi:DegV family protein with EDD domain